MCGLPHVTKKLRSLLRAGELHSTHECLQISNKQVFDLSVYSFKKFLRKVTFPVNTKNMVTEEFVIPVYLSDPKSRKSIQENHVLI